MCVVSFFLLRRCLFHFLEKFTPILPKPKCNKNYAQVDLGRVKQSCNSDLNTVCYCSKLHEVTLESVLKKKIHFENENEKVHLSLSLWIIWKRFGFFYHFEFWFHITIAVLTVALHFQFLILRHDCLRQIHHYSLMKTKRKNSYMSFSNAPETQQNQGNFFSLSFQ